MSRRVGPFGFATALLRFHGLSQDPQPLDRRSYDGTLRAGKRLPLDRRVTDLTVRARVRRR